MIYPLKYVWINYIKSHYKMESYKKSTYKYCIVPMCTNTTKATPSKWFFPVPKIEETRIKWCKHMKRCKLTNYPKLSAISSLHCCEDHFNLEEDTENFIQYQIMAKQEGKRVSLRLKKGVLPHRFECQKTNKQPVDTETQRTAVLKRQRLEAVQAALSESVSRRKVQIKTENDEYPADPREKVLIKSETYEYQADPRENIQIETENNGNPADPREKVLIKTENYEYQADPRENIQIETENNEYPADPREKVQIKTENDEYPADPRENIQIETENIEYPADPREKVQIKTENDEYPADPSTSLMDYNTTNITNIKLTCDKCIQVNSVHYRSIGINVNIRAPEINIASSNIKNSTTSPNISGASADYETGSEPLHNSESDHQRHNRLQKNQRKRTRRRRDSSSSNSSCISADKDPGPTKSNTKLQRSNQTVSPTVKTKECRIASPQGPKPIACYAAAATMADRKVVITSTSQGYITQAMSNLIVQRLTALLYELADGDNLAIQGPAFLGRPRYLHGALHLMCADQATEDWLKVSIQNLNIPNVEQLVALRQEYLPKRVRCSVLLPLVWQGETSRIGRHLRMSNPWAGVERWLVHDIAPQEKSNSTVVVVSVPDDLIPAIMANGRRLSFQLGVVYLKFQNAKGCFVKTPPTTYTNKTSEQQATFDISTTVEVKRITPTDAERTDPEQESYTLMNSEKMITDLVNLKGDSRQGVPFI